MTNRRDFITLLASAAVWPITVRGQQALPVIGFLHSAGPDQTTDRIAAFRHGLAETGFIEGRNVAIDFRWALDQYDRLPALAAELVHRQVSVIVTATNGISALAAKSATATIPIIFVVGIDPVEVGLVPRLSRPGDNLTGITSLNNELMPKRLQLMHDVFPATKVFAVLANPANAIGNDVNARELHAAAKSSGLQLEVFNTSSDHELQTAIAKIGELQVGPLVISNESFFTARSERIAALALRYRIPAIYQFRNFVAAGGLMSYGGNATESHRLLGIYTGRVLKGDKPGDLPVIQETKIELLINLKTAKALGITMPTSVLVRADEVIE